ncbi:4'-phosphopantetheinyl transferase family protein [Kitasatospora griseola]|uniref:4'-phosphopantetheinyl transferase family protein n=1 Tax=Kitasatospora griseola TaxID=2064 RepID=UPI0036DC1521
MDASRPGPERPPVTVWLCPDEALPPPLADALALHWSDRGERAAEERLLFAEDRRRHRVARALVRRGLALETGIPEAELALARSPLGRPYLLPPRGGLPRGGPHLDFNLSHTDGFCVLAVTRRGRVGVDVERLTRATGRPRDTEVLAAAFAPEERHRLRTLEDGRPRARMALRLWTLKEAYLKARGIGLAQPLDSFAFTLDDAGRVVDFRPPEDDLADRWRFLGFEAGPDVLVAVAVQPDGPAGEQTVLLHHGFPWRRGPARRLRCD